MHLSKSTQVSSRMARRLYRDVPTQKKKEKEKFNRELVGKKNKTRAPELSQKSFPSGNPDMDLPKQLSYPDTTFQGTTVLRRGWGLER